MSRYDDLGAELKKVAEDFDKLFFEKEGLTFLNVINIARILVEKTHGTGTVDVIKAVIKAPNEFNNNSSYFSTLDNSLPYFPIPGKSLPKIEKFLQENLIGAAAEQLKRALPVPVNNQATAELGGQGVVKQQQRHDDTLVDSAAAAAAAAAAKMVVENSQEIEILCDLLAGIPNLIQGNLTGKLNLLNDDNIRISDNIAQKCHVKPTVRWEVDNANILFIVTLPTNSDEQNRVLQAIDELKRESAAAKQSTNAGSLTDTKLFANASQSDNEKAKPNQATNTSWFNRLFQPIPAAEQKMCLLDEIETQITKLIARKGTPGSSAVVSGGAAVSSATRTATGTGTVGGGAQGSPTAEGSDIDKKIAILRRAKQYLNGEKVTLDWDGDKNTLPAYLKPESSFTWGLSATAKLVEKIINFAKEHPTFMQEQQKTQQNPSSGGTRLG